MGDKIINWPAAKDEAERLSKVVGREIKAKVIQCDCPGRKCYVCGGQSYYFELVYKSCGHSFEGDDRDEECYEDFCKEREKVQAVLDADPFTPKPLKSLSEAESERESREVA